MDNRVNFPILRSRTLTPSAKTLLPFNIFTGSTDKGMDIFGNHYSAYHRAFYLKKFKLLYKTMVIIFCWADLFIFLEQGGHEGNESSPKKVEWWSPFSMCIYMHIWIMITLLRTERSFLNRFILQNMDLLILCSVCHCRKHNYNLKESIDFKNKYIIEMIISHRTINIGIIIL